jgi:hypothetical protein
VFRGKMMNGGHQETVIFRELQQFRKRWFWTILVPLSLFLIIFYVVGIMGQIFLVKPWGDRPLPDTVLVGVGVVVILIAIGLPTLFYLMKLVTLVRTDGLFIRYIPFVNRKIEFSDIKRCEALTYRPIGDYGGWGIRGGRKGRAYNVSGKRGVQLELSTGEQLLVGSQRADELANAVKSMMKP